VTQEANDLLKKALELPAEDRAALAGSLIDSLDTALDPSAEDAWTSEVARRIEELDSGKAKTISREEVGRRISAKLDDGK